MPVGILRTTVDDLYRLTRRLHLTQPVAHALSPSGLTLHTCHITDMFRSCNSESAEKLLGSTRDGFLILASSRLFGQHKLLKDPCAGWMENLDWFSKGNLDWCLQKGGACAVFVGFVIPQRVGIVPWPEWGTVGQDAVWHVYGTKGGGVRCCCRK